MIFILCTTQLTTLYLHMESGGFVGSCLWRKQKGQDISCFGDADVRLKQCNNHCLEGMIYDMKK